MSFLRFARLAVRRMPAISDGGWTLDDLAPGINVIYGPNASGKTTTARAMEAVLWPGAAPSSAWIEATFRVDEEEWWAELDTRQATFQQGGRVATSPNVLPIESRDRYHLPLRQLLTESDDDLARVIVLESSGGFDLTAASEIIGPRKSLSRPKALQDDLRAARERLRRARAIQEELQTATATLAEDEVRLARREEMVRRAALLRLAARHAAVAEQSRVAARRLSEFHPAIARLAGDENAIYRDLGDRLAEARRTLHQAQSAEQAHREGLAAIDLPTAVTEGNLLRSLHQEVAEFAELEAAVGTQDAAVEEARSGFREEAARLENIADPELATSLDATSLSEFATAARAAHQARIRVAGLQAEFDAIDPVEPAGDRAKREQGAEYLRRWLTQASTPSGPSPTPLAMAGAIALIVSGLVFLVFTAWSLLLCATGLLLLVAIVVRRRAPAADPRSEFVSLGIDSGPENWEVDSVREALERLQTTIAEQRVAEVAAARAEPLRKRLAEARRQEADLAERLAEVSVRVGLNPDADAELIVILERISRLQDARNAVARLEGRRLDAWRRRSESLEAINDRLIRIEEEPAEDFAELRERMAGLEQQLEQYRSIHRAMEDARADQRHAAEMVGSIEEQIERLRVRLAVDRLEEGELAGWCEQRDEMLRARSDHGSLEGEKGRIEAELRGMPGFTEELLTPDLEALDAERSELDRRLTELEELRDRVVELRSEVERAKRGHDVEEALADLDRAELKLRDVRDRDARAHLAARLVEFVEEQGRNEHRPEVFHRADRIFSTITRGKYQLRLEDLPEPTFRAYDTQRQRTQALDELSSATRVQLLLAVRLAFVEAQESGVRLPLLLDETLANSDRDRSAAIIDSLIALGESGRQIFYFTAQADEVRRWKTMLGERGGIESRMIDLAEVRRTEQALPIEELEKALVEPVQFPAPNGDGHAAYAQRLEVPAIDPLDPPGRLHLWYLLDDPVRLHRVLSTLGVETLGAFRSLVRAGGDDLIDGDVVRRIEILGSVAESALNRLRVGRGKRVDRHVLEASGAVSQHFLDEVHEVARSVEWDGESLVNALENRAVSGFGEKRTETLRSFLEEEGFIDPRPQLRPDQIRIEVFRDTASLVAAGEVTREEIERLLGRLGVRIVREIRSVQADLELWN